MFSVIVRFRLRNLNLQLWAERGFSVTWLWLWWTNHIRWATSWKEVFPNLMIIKIRNYSHRLNKCLRAFIFCCMEIFHIPWRWFWANPRPFMFYKYRNIVTKISNITMWLFDFHRAGEETREERGHRKVWPQIIHNSVLPSQSRLSGGFLLFAFSRQEKCQRQHAAPPPPPREQTRGGRKSGVLTRRVHMIRNRPVILSVSATRGERTRSSSRFIWRWQQLGFLIEM